MNLSMIRYIAGWILSFEAAFLSLPCLIALLYREKEGIAFSFTLIRKYSQQLITNADRQGANRELITFNSGRLSAFLSSLCYAIERHF